MKSIEALRTAGLTVSSAHDAAGCTEVASDKPFWFFNPQFNRTPLEIYEALKQAHEIPTGGFRIVIGGEWDTGDLPFEILLPADKRYATNAYHIYKDSQAHADKLQAIANRLRDDLGKAVKGVLAYNGVAAPAVFCQQPE